MHRKPETNLPEFVYSNRTGQYQVQAPVINGERIVVLNTTNLDEARAISQLLKRIIDKAQKQHDKIHKQTIASIKRFRDAFKTI